MPVRVALNGGVPGRAEPGGGVGFGRGGAVRAGWRRAVWVGVAESHGWLGGVNGAQGVGRVKGAVPQTAG